MDVNKLLKKKQKAAGNNAALVSACTDLAQYYLSDSKFSKAIKEYEIVSNIYRSENKLVLYAQVNRGIGEAYMGLSDYEKALKHFKVHLSVSAQENDVLEQQRALAQLGHMFSTWYLTTGLEENKKYLVEAYRYFMKSMKKCDSLPDNIEKQDMLARLFANLGLVKECQGEYDTSYSLYEKSLKICLKHELYEQLYRNHMGLASLFEKQGKYNETIKHYNLAIETAKKLSTNRVELVCAALLAKSETLIKLADFTGAKHYLRKAYKFKTPNKQDRKTIERCLRVVAAMCKIEDEIIITNNDREFKNLHEKMGDGACDLKNFSKAIEYYKKMLETAEAIGCSDKELAECYYSLGETYKDNAQYDEAESLFEKEYDLCKNSLKDGLNTLCKIADLKEQAKNNIEEIKRVYERALDNCRSKRNFKEEKRILLRYMDFLRRYKCHSEAFKLEQHLNALTKLVEDEDDDASSSSENESEESETKVHIGDDIILSDVTDMSEDSDYDVPEASAAPIRPRRKQTKEKLKRNATGEWPLHVACIKGDLKMVEHYLNLHHPVNVRDNAGWLPLHEAANHGFVEIVRQLLDHKAAINDRGGSECKGITPLHDACGNGHLDVVKLLLDRGASALVKTDEGHTPLFELKRWYDKSGQTISFEDRDLYQELEKRLSEALERAGQTDVLQDNSSIYQSPEKPSTSKVSPRMGLSRRNAYLYEDEDDSDDLTGNLEENSEEYRELDKSASNEYQTVMKSLRHKNYPSDQQSPLNSPAKRSAYVAAEDCVDEDDWLEEDVRPTKPKRRKTDESLTLTTRSRSFGNENKSPRRKSQPAQAREAFELPDNIIDVDSEAFQTPPNFRRRSNESNDSNVSAKAKKKTQATLLDAGFSKKRNSSSPGIKSTWNRQGSTDSLTQTRITACSKNLSSSIEADSTTLPHSQSDFVNVDPTLFVDVQIEGRLFRVPIFLSQIHNQTIKWLAGEAANRYASKEYMRPTLELETVSGAVLADDDLLSLLFPMGSTQAENVVGKVIEWSLPPLIDRYKETCRHMNVDINTELCQLIDTLSINLDLLNGGLLGERLSPLFKAINHQKSLTEINLSGNFLNTTCLNFLFTSMVTLPNLRVLNLSCTGLQCSHLSLLAQTLTNHCAVFSNLSVLDLSDNLHLGRACLRDLAFITNIVNLTALNLRNINLSGVAGFGDGLCLKTVERLDVSYNNLENIDIKKLLFWTDRGVLKDLNLSNNKATASTVTLFEVFDEDKSITLETVSLVRCGVRDTDLLELLRLAPNLSSLNLSYNPDLTSISLRRLLGRSNLRRLDLMCCDNIWKYFNVVELGWETNLKGDSEVTALKLSGGSDANVDFIVNLFQEKYSNCNVIRAYDFVSITVIHS